MDQRYQNQSMREHQNIPAGFRLARLEVYNWGTFNQRVWIMSPCDGTALLTGANASGKSTLVDALLTLLVPYNKRTYNQASGAEKHRERDERTYILGAWSKQKESASSQARIEYLRDKTSYSVLLAVFHNARSKSDVTLAQFLRIQEDGSPYKFFVVAPKALSILEHFRLTGTPTDLRKQLRAMGAEVYNDFAAYSRHFRQLVNVRSEQAFDLFNQIVSIKEIGGLNAFVREHMLEKTNAQDRIARLRENFENLTRAHDAILLAQKQLGILEPLIKDADRYEELQMRIGEAQRSSELVPFYVAERKYTLLQAAITKAEQEYAVKQQQLNSLLERIEGLDQQRISLNVAISNDLVGQQLAQKRQQIKQLTDQRASKQKAASKYNGLADSLGLPTYQDETTFYETTQQLAPLLAQSREHAETFQQKRDTVIQRMTAAQERYRALQEEIASLQQRKSQIPSQDIALRNRLCSALNIAEDDLPFIGELIRVLEHEQRWEPVAERLLHGYALQLLVPEKHYLQVSRFVEQTDLGRRLVYHRVSREQRTPRNANFSDRSMLYNKLEVKRGTPFSAWLSADLIDRYDYQCSETLEDFQQARRAVTSNGQIKHNPVTHEKDDRRPLGDHASYVLGWNNKEKLVALAKQLEEQQGILASFKHTLKGIEREHDRLRLMVQNTQLLQEFESFADIDWRSDERTITLLKTEVQELEKQPGLATLQAQLERVNTEFDNANKQKSALDREIATLLATLSRYTEQRRVCDHKRQNLSASAAIGLEPIVKEHGGKALTLDTVDGEESVLVNLYARRVSSLQGQVNTLQPHIVLSMETLRQTSTRIAQETDASLEAIGQYRNYYEQIKREDLPRHSKRFKELLNDNIIIDINSFKAALEQQEKNIEESIDKLNKSLSKIDYTPSTYIQLRGERTHDQEVRDFKNELRACLPDVSQQRTAEANEASFQRIRILLQRFEQEERWTAKVTNVRNWLDFSAEELYRADDRRKNYYSDSSGKSGGQKTKLAYTIMASAIAYQYGLDQEAGNDRAFRFVVVDEAFSKSDEMNARYAMELFKQLDLQLLVVTPLDKIHVIEPYISACHYVVNTEEENDSRVYNLSIAQYQQQKQAIQMGAMVSDYAS